MMTITMIVMGVTIVVMTQSRGGGGNDDDGRQCTTHLLMSYPRVASRGSYVILCVFFITLFYPFVFCRDKWRSK